MDYDDAGIQTRGARAVAMAVMQASASWLALAFDEGSSNSANVLLQMREWFPPARVLAALAAFRQSRLAFAAASHKQQSSTVGPHPTPDDLDSALGDDPLAASSGQVIVDIESKYRIIYHLVNTIYILVITTVDRDSDRGRSNNVFECINTVNQAVSIVVAACHGGDVTPEKLHRKYPEIYMALDIILLLPFLLLFVLTTSRPVNHHWRV